MKSAVIRISEAAALDILEQADWYEQKSGVPLRDRWEDAVMSSLDRVRQFPNSGSACNFGDPELTGIRRITVKGFSKHLIFYRLERDGVEGLPILHGARDIESLFA